MAVIFLSNISVRQFSQSISMYISYSSIVVGKHSLFVFPHFLQVAKRFLFKSTKIPNAWQDSLKKFIAFASIASLGFKLSKAFDVGKNRIRCNGCAGYLKSFKATRIASCSYILPFVVAPMRQQFYMSWRRYFSFQKFWYETFPNRAGCLGVV